MRWKFWRKPTLEEELEDLGKEWKKLSAQLQDPDNREAMESFARGGKKLVEDLRETEKVIKETIDGIISFWS